MAMFSIHVVYIICLVANDARHAYDVTVVYNIPHGDGRISYFAEPAILWLAGAVMGTSGTVTFNGARNTVVD